ncbi:DUF551 domain-containing protein [Bacteroides sp.]|uniref:DUF551 domain-containing protein n=1 Tax=Bacteroides sp. TaxID=29523 RepID=UPI002FC9D130
MTELEKTAERISFLYEKIIDNQDWEISELDELLDLSRKDGIEWKAKQSPWISVEGRLPEKDGLRVWVKSNCLNEQPLVYWKGKFYARLSDGCYDGSVTHWMPIPE